MLNHFIHVLVFAVAVLVTARLVPGIRVKSFTSAVIFSFVLAVLDKLLYGVLVFFSFPLILVSFGLFLFVINAILWSLADKLVGGVETKSFGTAIIGSAVTSLINYLFLRLLA